jgi:hypothetical protein
VPQFEIQTEALPNAPTRGEIVAASSTVSQRYFIAGP